jgi:hypothetical protein
MPPTWRPPNASAYSYLLGLYLGDGYIVVGDDHSPRLELTLGDFYSEIVGAAQEAVRESMPDVSVRVNACPGKRSVRVAASHPYWLLAFPQHGSGRKHKRRIWLAEWQERITRRHPKELIRGLIHSDGARCVNRFQTHLPGGRIAEYAYPRYFFSNLSEDIRRIFCEHCELLGIRWTQSNHRNISVSHRDSVALLDTFVGPKR